MPPRSPANVRGGAIGGGGYGLEWDGRKVLEAMNEANLAAMRRVAERARQYWDGEEWTPGRHPYMTGDENSIKENGYFDVLPNERGTVSLYVGSTSDHTMFEEVGTSRQEAHQPIRNTVDKVAYSISDELRRAARSRGFT